MNPGIVLHVLSLIILTTFLFEVSSWGKQKLPHCELLCTKHFVASIIYFCSVLLTFFFSVKIVLKLVAFRFKYFTHKFEVFDGAIVVVSWILDVASMYVGDVGRGGEGGEFRGTVTV